MAIEKSINYKKAEGKDLGRVGVLMGGPSTEREISLKSGKAVYEALKQAGIDAVPIDIQTEGKRENMRILRRHKIDCAFIALHGHFGEDGGIQKILETLKIPYTGSGVKASKLAMDKITSRKIFEVGGLRVPAYQELRKSSFKKTFTDKNLKLPLVVKPATHGSSIGLSIIDKIQDLNKAIELAFSFDNRIIIESFIRGRELTAGVLGDCALAVIEIIPKKVFFDFEAKYQPGMTEYIVPAEINDKITRRIQKSALYAHRLLGCRGCSRTDIILDRKNIPFILEVNTIPGLTSMSLLPKAARAGGIEFGQLCLSLVKMAYEKK